MLACFPALARLTVRDSPPDRLILRSPKGAKQLLDRDANRYFARGTCTANLGLHSVRNAWVGLIEEARRAGIQAATSATRMSAIGTNVNVSASCGEMP